MPCYDVEKFDPTPAQDLICCICTNVLCDPVETPCRHVFCKKCVIKWTERKKTCPTCRRKIEPEKDIKPVLPLVQSLINRLIIRCKNFDSGCCEKIFLEHYDSHCDVCMFEQVPCGYSKCKDEMLRKDLETHRISCKFREKKCSKKCGLLVLLTDVKNHDCFSALLAKLHEKETEIQNMAETMKSLKQNVEKLQEEVKTLLAQQTERGSHDTWPTDTSDTDAFETEEEATPPTGRITPEWARTLESIYSARNVNTPEYAPVYQTVRSPVYDVDYQDLWNMEGTGGVVSSHSSDTSSGQSSYRYNFSDTFSYRSGSNQDRDSNRSNIGSNSYDSDRSDRNRDIDTPSDHNNRNRDSDTASDHSYRNRDIDTPNDHNNRNRDSDTASDHSYRNRDIDTPSDRTRFSDRFNYYRNNRDSDTYSDRTNRDRESDTLSEHSNRGRESDTLSEHSNRGRESDTLSECSNRGRESDTFSEHSNRGQESDILSDNGNRSEVSGSECSRSNSLVSNVSNNRTYRNSSEVDERSRNSISSAESAESDSNLDDTRNSGCEAGTVENAEVSDSRVTVTMRKRRIVSEEDSNSCDSNAAQSVASHHSSLNMSRTSTPVGHQSPASEASVGSNPFYSPVSPFKSSTSNSSSGLSDVSQRSDDDGSTSDRGHESGQGSHTSSNEESDHSYASKRDKYSDKSNSCNEADGSSSDRSQNASNSSNVDCVSEEGSSVDDATWRVSTSTTSDSNSTTKIRIRRTKRGVSHNYVSSESDIDDENTMKRKRRKYNRTARSRENNGSASTVNNSDNIDVTGSRKRKLESVSSDGNVGKRVKVETSTSGRNSIARNGQLSTTTFLNLPNRCDKSQTSENASRIPVYISARGRNDKVKRGGERSSQSGTSGRNDEIQEESSEMNRGSQSPPWKRYYR